MKNSFQEINTAVINLNKTLSKNGFRFVLFVEGFDTGSDETTSSDEEDDTTGNGDIVAPNKEVSAYPVEKLLLSLGGFDPANDTDNDLSTLAYTSQYNSIMAGALIGSVMASDDRVYKLVKYGYLCGKMESAAIRLMEYDSPDDVDDDGSNDDFRDIEDDEDD